MGLSLVEVTIKKLDSTITVYSFSCLCFCHIIHGIRILKMIYGVYVHYQQAYFFKKYGVHEIIHCQLSARLVKSRQPRVVTE